MIVFQDIFTNDEVISDSYNPRPVYDGEELVPGLFEAESRLVPVGGQAINIGSDDQDQFDDTVETENNIISERAGFGYTEMPFGSKGEFVEYLKEYVKRVRQQLKTLGVPQADIKQFMADAPLFVKYLAGKYEELQFYVSRSMDPDAGMIYALFKPGASTPTFMYIRGGLRERKV